MDLSQIHQVVVVGSLALVGICIGIAWFRVGFVLPRKRKAFLIKEMGHCLDTRESVMELELINHCRTILHNIDLHCHMREAFMMRYTYGKHEIGVNWYHVTGLFEFKLIDSQETIARIYYPT